MTEIIEKDGGYKLSSNNAESEEVYYSYEDALEAIRADDAAYESASDDAEAQELSPVHWIC